MSYIFISHSSRNNFEAIALQEWLIEQGWDELFLDLDPERGIAAGERWERALHEAANCCDAVLFLVSQEWLDSDWCRREFRLAHRLNKRIFGVLIGEVNIASLPDELTETWQLINLSSGQDHQLIRSLHPDSGEERHVNFSRSGLTRLRVGLIKAGLDPRFFEWPPKHEPNRQPYRGMRPLEADDAGIFFGREAPTIELLAQLRGLREDSPPRFLVILGASGAGKSSFLRAGILPRLIRDERYFLPLPIVRPEQAVLWGDNGLLIALESAFAQQEMGVTRGALRIAIEESGDQLISLLQQLMKKATPPTFEGEAAANPPTLVLAIDQGEELFQSEGADEAKAFLELLHTLANEARLPLIVLFTIRSDAYERLQTSRSLEGMQQQTFSLLPMPQGAFQNIIEGPTKRLKESGRPLDLDPKLTQRLLHDLDKGSGKDALPLLAFTLERLFLEYGGDGDLRLDEYEDMGGIEGAIEAAVEQAFKAAEQDPALPNDRQALKHLLRRGLIPWLAGIDPDTQAPRRRVAKLNEIPAEAQPLIQHLIEQRLLATDIDIETKESTIEPAHEALLRQWGLLQGWLEEDFAALSIMEGVQRASREWEANNRAEDWLNHSAGRLEDAEHLKQRDDFARFLNPSDWDYLERCREREIQQRDRELAEARRLADTQKRVAKRTMIGMVVALCLMVVAGGMGWQAYKHGADAEQRLEEANHNLGLALHERSKQAVAEKRYNQASYYSAQAYSRLQLGTEEAAEVAGIWFSATAKSVRPTWISWSTQHHSDIIYRVSFSPDGKTLASSSSDKTIRLWDIATGSTLATLQGHSDIIHSISFSPDSKTLASASFDKTIRLWDTATGNPLATFQGHSEHISSVSFSPDGKTLALGSWDKTIRLWDIATGSTLATFQGHSRMVNSVSFSPDGKTLASASNDRTIRLWDITMGSTLGTLQGHSDSVHSVSFSPDGKTLASGSEDNTIRLWDITTGSTLATLQGHSSGVNGVSFSPDGKTLASASNDRTIRLWDITTGSTLATLQDLSNGVSFSPDGKTLASTSGSNTIHLWDITTGSALTSFQGNLNNIKISPDGKTLAFASYDKAIRLWDITTGSPLATLQDHSRGISCVSFSPNGKTLASASFDKTIRLWDIATGSTLAIFQGHSRIVESVSFSPDGKILVSVSPGDIHLWDITTGSTLGTLQGHSEHISSVSFSPDGKTLAAASWDKSIRLWDITTGSTLSTLQGHSDSVLSVSFSPDGKTLASGSQDKTIRLWDIATGSTLDTLQGHSSGVNGVSFSADGKTLASASFDNVRLWDVTTGDHLATLQGHSGSIHRVSFSPVGQTLTTALSDGTIRQWDIATRSIAPPALSDNVDRGNLSPDDKTLASASGDTIHLWDVTTGSTLATLKGHSKGVNGVSFSPNGKTLASASFDESVRLWDVATGAPLATLQGTDSVYNVHFSPDSKTLALDTNDKTIRLWDIATGSTLATLQGHSGYIRSISFSPDGKTLASASFDESVRLWDVATGSPLAILNKFGVSSVNFSPDSKTLASISYRTISLWDIATDTITTLQGHSDDVNRVSFSPDSKTLASTSSDMTVRLWDIATGSTLTTLQGHSDSVYSVSFSPDGKTLASTSWGSNTIIRLWDIASGTTLGIFQNLSSDINSVSFSLDGKTLTSASGDKTIRSLQQFRDNAWREQWIKEQELQMGYYLEGINIHIKQPEPNLYGNQTKKFSTVTK